jgi:hypothetical protein
VDYNDLLDMGKALQMNQAQNQEMKGIVLRQYKEHVHAGNSQADVVIFGGFMCSAHLKLEAQN